MMAMAMTQRDEVETVELAGVVLDVRELVRYVHPGLWLEACEFAGVGATAQAVLDEYARLHRARFGVEFASAPLAAR